MLISEELIDRCCIFVKDGLRTQGIPINPYVEMNRLRTEFHNGNDNIDFHLNQCRRRIEQLKRQLAVEELIEIYFISISDKTAAESEKVKVASSDGSSATFTEHKLQFEKLCKQFSNLEVCSASKAKSPVVGLKNGPFRNSDECKLHQCGSLRLSGQRYTKASSVEVENNNLMRNSLDSNRNSDSKIETKNLGNETEKLLDYQTVTGSTKKEMNSTFNEATKFDINQNECPLLLAQDSCSEQNIVTNNETILNRDIISSSSSCTEDNTSYLTIEKNGRKCSLEKKPKQSEEIFKEQEDADSDEEQYMVIRYSMYQSRLFGNASNLSLREMLEKKAERLSKRFSSVECIRSSHEIKKMESLPELSPIVAETFSIEEMPDTPSVQMDIDNASVLDLNIDSPFLSHAQLPNEDSAHKLDMRHVILSSLLDSELSYVKILDSLLGYKQIFIKNQVISVQEIETIFFKVPELRAIHSDFSQFLQSELMTHNRGERQVIGNAFKALAIEEFSIALSYLKNYAKAVNIIQNCCNTNNSFDDFVKEITSKSPNEKNALEDMLHQPIVQFQKSTYLLNDLIKYTPATHPDYDLLQKTLGFAKNFLDQIDFQPPDNQMFDKQRYLAKHGLIVEKVNKVRKLRHIFLFNDIIIAAKQKPASRSNNPYEIKWFIPLLEVSLEDRLRVEDDKLLEKDHSEEISNCKKKIKELQNEYQIEAKKAKKQMDNSKIKLRNPRVTSKNLEKIIKKLKEQEVTLVMALPRLSFNIYHRRVQKHYCLLMSSDYERTLWREMVTGLIGKAQPLVSFSQNDAQLLLNSPKMVKATGAVLEKACLDEEDLLYGPVRLKVIKLSGLNKLLDMFCDIEIDSFGHFEKKARTSLAKMMAEPMWDEVFDIDLEGTRTLRLLCYSKDSSTGMEVLLGKGALELRWLNDKEKDHSISLNHELQVLVSLEFLCNRQPSVRGKLFGATFEEIVRNESGDIPFLIKCCTQIVEEHGLKEEGIYRISGNMLLVEELKELFETEPQQAEIKAKSYDIHVVTGLIKLFFRTLPEALFTDNLYCEFVKGLELKDPDACSNCLRNLMKRLPKGNAETAKLMIRHLLKVSKEENLNKMGLKNLAVVFGPTLFRSPTKSQDSVPDEASLFIFSVAETVKQVRILQQVLTIFPSVPEWNNQVSSKT